jgi:hypothetical protein
MYQVPDIFSAVIFSSVLLKIYGSKKVRIFNQHLVKKVSQKKYSKTNDFENKTFIF